MTETWPIIIVLALATFTIRLSGILLGQRLPDSGPWARALNALPGCLIISLVSALVLSGGINEFIAGALAVVVALVTRSLPLTMAVGILAIYGLRLL